MYSALSGFDKTWSIWYTVGIVLFYLTPTSTTPTCIDNMSQSTYNVLLVVATTSPRGAAYRREPMTSVLTSVPEQETSYDTVAMHDGPMIGELRLQIIKSNCIMG